MEKYIINGVEVEYDTFDLDAMQLFDDEVKAIKEDVEAARDKGWNSENYIQVLREQCENILDFFDTVLGDGAARKVFGSRMNIRDIMEGYRKFTSDVAKTRSELKNTDGPAPATNREQRRPVERQRRRKEAARATETTVET